MTRRLKLPEDVANRVRLDHTDEELADMARRYAAHESTAEIGRRYNMSAKTAACRLKALGVDMRPRGRIKNKPLTAGGPTHE